MNCRAPILDRLVAAARGGDNGDAPKQGRALSLPAPEPWQEPVEGAALLDRVDIQRVQMNALMMDSMDMNALGVCS